MGKLKSVVSEAGRDDDEAQSSAGAGLCLSGPVQYTSLSYRPFPCPTYNPHVRSTTYRCYLPPHMQRVLPNLYNLLRLGCGTIVKSYDPHSLSVGCVDNLGTFVVVAMSKMGRSHPPVGRSFKHCRKLR